MEHKYTYMYIDLVIENVTSRMATVKTARMDNSFFSIITEILLEKTMLIKHVVLFVVSILYLNSKAMYGSGLCAAKLQERMRSGVLKVDIFAGLVTLL